MTEPKLGLCSDSNFYDLVSYTSLDAARVQLDTAIAMFFLGFSPAIIHTVVGASQEILRSIKVAQARKCGEPPVESLLDSHPDLSLNITGQRYQNFARNFLKHLNPKGPRQLKIRNSLNEWWILDCIWSWRALGFRDTTLIWIFFAWLIECHGSPFPDEMTEGLSPEEISALYEEFDIPAPTYLTSDYHDWFIEKMRRYDRTGMPGWLIAHLGPEEEGPHFPFSSGTGPLQGSLHEAATCRSNIENSTT